MSTFVLMRLLESAPRRYDAGIELLSLGQHRRVLDRMAGRVSAGDRVLDIGCGTGSLVLLCAKRGARVAGIDASPSMLRLAKRKLEDAGLAEAVDLREMSAIDLDEWSGDGAFDVVLSSFAFSELSEDEQRFVLQQSARLLAPYGRLLVADEVLPRGFPARLLSRLVRFPLLVLAYLLTQTTTRAVTGLDAKVACAGFEIDDVERHLFGGVELVSAIRKEPA